MTAADPARGPWLTPAQWALVEELVRRAEPYPLKLAGLLRGAFRDTYALARAQGQTVAEIQHTCLVAACGAARTFDPARGAFVTHATWKMRSLVFASCETGKGRRALRARTVSGDTAALSAVGPAGPTALAGTRAPRGLWGSAAAVDRTAPDPADAPAAADEAAKLRAAVAALPARQRRLVELRFGLDGAGERSFPAAGAAAGVTGEAARLAVGKALETLRVRLGGAC